MRYPDARGPVIVGMTDHGELGIFVTFGNSSRRLVVRSASIAALVMASSIVLSGCAAEVEASASAGPAVSATPTAASPTPESTDAPREPAPLPTQSAQIDEVVELSTGIDVSITGARSIDVEAQTPGEVSGSAVAVTVLITNQTQSPASVDSAVVSLVADDGELGIPTTAGPVEPLLGELAAGSSIEATYVFMLNDARERAVGITVNHAAGEPVAAFHGRTS